ncbi:MAG: ABC transporter substrate-binding protein [Chloroflexi bacterium]|nr:ABC transporter substrate-binding protein [Chloroflexota bacterium]
MIAKRSWLLVSVVMAIALLLGACQPAPTATPETPEAAAQESPQVAEATEMPAVSEGEMEKEPIRIADTQWQTLWINDAIAQFIIENGYGYPVEIIEMTTPVFQQSIVSGDVDLIMEIWRQNLEEWYTKVMGEGTVVDLGETFEKSTQGFYVPRYVVEGDAERGIEPVAPDLKSVFDLPQYKSVFQDPENPDKGLIINCITGWQCAEVNRVKLAAYGLDGDYNLLEPGASAALDAAIAGAYEKGEPVVSYYWEPTWLLGRYDMIQLEEPEYTQACWDELNRALAGEVALEDVGPEAGCAYETVGIHKAAAVTLVERAPEVTAFLEKMNVGTDPLNKTAAYMEVEGASADEAAIWFLNEYSDRWHEWVPEDVAAKIEQALAAAGE